MSTPTTETSELVFTEVPGGGYAVTAGGELVGYVARSPVQRHVWHAYADAGHDELVAQRDTRKCAGRALLRHQIRELRARVAVLERAAGGAPLRIAIDADCPRCGHPERFWEPERGVYGCSSLNPQACGYESTERDA